MNFKAEFRKNNNYIVFDTIAVVFKKKLLYFIKYRLSPK